MTTPSPRLPMQPPKPTEVSQGATQWKIRIKDGVYVVGKRDSGKTVLIYYLVLQMAKAKYAFDIWDVVGNLKPLADKLRKQGVKVNYALVNPHDEELVERLALGVLQRGNTMLILDEADRYNYYVGKKSALSDIINLGRNYNIGYVAATRRGAEVAKDFIANADWSFVFRALEGGDVKRLVSDYSLPEEDFRGLEDHQFLVIYHERVLARAKLGVGAVKETGL